MFGSFKGFMVRVFYFDWDGYWLLGFRCLGFFGLFWFVFGIKRLRFNVEFLSCFYFYLFKEVKYLLRVGKGLGS